jgi:ComF family protein
MELRDHLSLSLKNLLLPAFCRRCDSRILTEENLYYCPACWSQIDLIERPFCTLCGKPHDKATGFAERENFPCAECGQKKRHLCDRMYAATIYDDLVQEAIVLFKYGSRQLLAGPLAKLMIEFAQREIEFERYDAIVPVPLHRVRKRERGFNQAEDLARRLAERVPKLPVCTGLLRSKATPQQTGRLNAAERRRNVQGAFAVVEGADFCGQKILLIDDVITTGATVDECARTLRRAGAKLVDAFAAARAAHTVP